MDLRTKYQNKMNAINGLCTDIEKILSMSYDYECLCEVLPNVRNYPEFSYDNSARLSYVIGYVKAMVKQIHDEC